MLAPENKRKCNGAYESRAGAAAGVVRGDVLWSPCCLLLPLQHPRLLLRPVLVLPASLACWFSTTLTITHFVRRAAPTAVPSRQSARLRCFREEDTHKKRKRRVPSFAVSPHTLRLAALLTRQTRLQSHITPPSLTPLHIHNLEEACAFFFSNHNVAVFA